MTEEKPHEFIKGIELTERLPEGTALVLEGGGLRGFYSSGVMEAFMERKILFPYIAGVSAGAANALSYISGQRMRSREIIENYVCTPRYVSRRNLVFKGSLFDFDYVFGTIPEKLIPFDWKTFCRQDTRFLTGTMDAATGNTVWFEKEDIMPPFDASIASCSIPFLTKIHNYRGYELVDGGVSCPIPIEKSIDDGNVFHVIVLTRNPGYRKKESGHERFFRLLSRRHPAIADAMFRRAEIYNRQIGLCEELEREGKAVIIRPQEPIKVKRASSDVKTLLELHDEGVAEGRAALDRILRML